MERAADRLYTSLRNSKSVGEGFQVFAAAVTTEPVLAFGLVAIVGIVYLLGRIYIWPTINPFQIQWISNFWDWLTTPYVPPDPQKDYPYAKVIYPTYR